MSLSNNFITYLLWYLFCDEHRATNLDFFLDFFDGCSYGITEVLVM